VSVILTYVDERLAEDPMRLSKPLRYDLAGTRSARSGDYRILFTMDESSPVLSIIRVDHRAHAYRPT